MFDPGSSAAISQTGLVPADSRWLLFKGRAYAAPSAPPGIFTVSLDGQTVPVSVLATYADYSLYGGEIVGFAGREVELRFTVLGGYAGTLQLDSIEFPPFPSLAPWLRLGWACWLRPGCAESGQGGPWYEQREGLLEAAEVRRAHPYQLVGKCADDVCAGARGHSAERGSGDPTGARQPDTQPGQPVHGIPPCAWRLCGLIEAVHGWRLNGTGLRSEVGRLEPAKQCHTIKPRERRFAFAP